MYPALQWSLHGETVATQSVVGFALASYVANYSVRKLCSGVSYVKRHSTKMFEF